MIASAIGVWPRADGVVSKKPQSLAVYWWTLWELTKVMIPASSVTSMPFGTASSSNRNCSSSNIDPTRTQGNDQCSAGQPRLCDWVLPVIVLPVRTNRVLRHEASSLCARGRSYTRG